MHSEAARRDDCSMEEIGPNIVRARISFVSRVAPPEKGVVVLSPQSENKKKSNGTLRKEDEMLPPE